VVRGGSWSSAPRDLCSTCRSRNRPRNRYRSLGFRVVCGFPPA
jgi:formylglycine-generating enzyme required for sulfatase activity